MTVIFKIYTTMVTTFYEKNKLQDGTFNIVNILYCSILGCCCWVCSNGCRQEPRPRSLHHFHGLQTWSLCKQKYTDLTAVTLVFEIIGKLHYHSKKGLNAYLTSYCDMLHVIYLTFRFFYKISFNDHIWNISNFFFYF